MIEDMLLESLPAAATVREHINRLATEQELLRQPLAVCEAKEQAGRRLAEPCRPSPAAKRRK